MDPDLRTIRGTLWADGLDATWHDPLAPLPDAPDDLNALRTFPGRPEQGQVTWTEQDGALHFVAELPRRWGTVGATRKGLFASGRWYPQPMVGDELPVVTWDVTVQLPPHTGGALGDVAGDDVLRWSGMGERAPLAVVRRPVFTPVAPDVTLLTRGRPREVLVRELTRELERAELPDVSWSGNVVEAPLRRRLTGGSPGLAWVSDRAFRLTPGLQRYHRAAVLRGVVSGLLPVPDPFERELAAAAVSHEHAGRLRGDDAHSLLSRFAWLPQINAILSSRRLPFYGEVLERTHPTDPVRDDLVEQFAPYTPGTVVLAQLDDTYGPGTGARIGLALARGQSLTEAAALASVPLEEVEAWRAPYPVQDYVLAVEDGEIRVTRHAPDDAPTETVVLALDGQHLPIRMAPGETVTLTPSPSPRRVVLDPLHHVDQRSRMRDSWPPRYAVTLAAGITAINLNRGQVYGSGQMSLRRQYDTRNLWFGEVYTSPGTLMGAGLTWLRKAGRLQDGWNRPHRLTLGGGVGLLNPDFALVDRIRPSLTTSVGYAWDSRVGQLFPLRGHRLGASLGGGLIPGLDERWGYAQLHAVGLIPLHPRHVLAGRANLAGAMSNVPWRQLSLAGGNALISLPVLPACATALEDEPCAEQADLRAVAAWEYRAAPLRELSVPLFLAWGNELQLTFGAEGAVGRVDGQLAAAAGLTAGIAGTADILGAHTELLGITAGWPVWWTGPVQGGPGGLDARRPWVPEIYLRWAQAF